MPGLLLRTLVRNALAFTLVFLFLMAWRCVAESTGLMTDEPGSLDWVHRTFLIITVYTCGSTFICNVMRSGL
jgi:hypothetical protein